MKRTIEQPVRLIDAAGAPLPLALAEVRASVQAAAAGRSELSESAQRRIRRRLQASVGGYERPPRTRMWIAVAFGVVMLVSGVVGATVGSVVTTWLAHGRPTQQAPARQSPPRERTRGTSPGVSAQPSPPPAPLPDPPLGSGSIVLPSASAPAPPPARPRPARLAVASHFPAPQQTVPSFAAPAPPLPAVQRAELPTSPVAPPPVAEPDPAAVASGVLRQPPRSISAASSPRPAADTLAANRDRDEAVMLGEAIRLLHVQGNPRAALALLDREGTFLTAGTFGPEAAALRIEILLALGRTQAALDDLERLPITTLPNATEWQVVRAELRGKAGRWPAAEEDFAATLAARPGWLKPDLEERALWGQAVARTHQGNASGARADAERYLRRFPRGRFRAEAARLAAPSP